MFADIYEGVHELTVVEKIWSIIIDVIAIVAEIFTIDENELMEQIIRDNRRLKAMQLYTSRLPHLKCCLVTCCLHEFYISSRGASDPQSFSAQNITDVKVVWDAGSAFKTLLPEAEFNLVASRAAQAKVIKAIKAGENSVDLNMPIEPEPVEPEPEPENPDVV